MVYRNMRDKAVNTEIKADREKCKRKTYCIDSTYIE